MPEQPPKILIDLDRTLFDTGKFIELLWPWLASTYGIDIEQAKEEMKTYTHWVGDMYDYDFFAHMAALGISKQDIITRAPRNFNRTSFLFDDVVPFLQRLMLDVGDAAIAILTFGTSDYQHFKLRFCPNLDYFDVYTTQVHKREYIEATWPHQPMVLIDDKLLAGALPVTTTFIHLDRTQHEPIIDHATYKSVRELTDIRKEWLL